MKKTTIDIKAESFPWHIKLMGALLLIGALALITSYWWVSILLTLAGLTALTGHSGTEINLANKTFREYNSFLLVRTGSKEKYDQIESVFINEKEVSTHTSHPSRLYFFRVTVYNAYLKFMDGRKIFLTSRSDKAKLLKLLHPVVTALSVELADNTAMR
jgi:hypothetical protein